MREDALVYMFVRVRACVLLCVCLYACAGVLYVCASVGGVPIHACVSARVCLYVQGCFCAYP